ncbi:MAG: ribosomal protein S18-alanine N-acetyltransferase [Polyangiaceae bacterium]
MAFDIGKIRDDEIDRVSAMDREAFARGADAAGVDIYEETQRTWSLVWVARDAGVPVGYLVAWHVADELHLLMIATAHEARRRGVARALMEKLIAFSASSNVMHIFLEVRLSNEAAIALYRAFGFFRLSLRKKYYPDGEDALELALALDPLTREILPREDEPI